MIINVNSDPVLQAALLRTRSHSPQHALHWWSICCNSGVRRASTLEGRVRCHQSCLLTLYISVTLASCSERGGKIVLLWFLGHHICLLVWILLVETHSRLGSACIISVSISIEVMLDCCESIKQSQQLLFAHLCFFEIILFGHSARHDYAYRPCNPNKKNNHSWGHVSCSSAGTDYDCWKTGGQRIRAA